jgi:PhnB protein
MAEEKNTPPVTPIGGVTPYLTVVGGKAAVAFYIAAFGAVELFRNVADDGERLMHSRMVINDGLLMLSDDFAENRGGALPPPPTGVMMHLQVADADLWFDRAVAAGATVKMPLADMFWGDRYGQLLDPFGHSWTIAGPLKGT